MNVILVEPNKKAEPIEIGESLKDLQHTVGGYIEVLYPFDDNVAVVCNDEGKINALPLNRALYDEDGVIYDIVCGTFLIVGCSEENFCSLTPNQLKLYTDMYLYPEEFINLNGYIHCLKFER